MRLWPSRRRFDGAIGGFLCRAGGALPRDPRPARRPHAREAFHSDWFATAVGLLVVAIAIISAVAISVGSAGYLAVFLSLPAPVLITAVVLAMGAIAVWGVKESVTFAATMTVIEIGGLLVLILAGFALKTEIVTRMPEIVAVDASPVVLAGLEICKQPT